MFQDEHLDYQIRKEMNDQHAVVEQAYSSKEQANAKKLLANPELSNQHFNNSTVERRIARSIIVKKDNRDELGLTLNRQDHEGDQVNIQEWGENCYSIESLQNRLGFSQQDNLLIEDYGTVDQQEHSQYQTGKDDEHAGDENLENEYEHAMVPAPGVRHDDHLDKEVYQSIYKETKTKKESSGFKSKKENSFSDLSASSLPDDKLSQNRLLNLKDAPLNSEQDAALKSSQKDVSQIKPVQHESTKSPKLPLVKISKRISKTIDEESVDQGGGSQPPKKLNFRKVPTLNGQ